jgi:hypothetical protein
MRDIRRLQLASRILLATAAHVPPDDGDLVQLRELAESDRERRLPLDELAREVMMREVRRNRGRATAAANVAL